jgi:hypothetical protein
MTDDELRNFLIEFRRGLLGRRASTQACFMLCAPLSTLLAIHGVPNTLVETWLKPPPRNHVWLRLSDGRRSTPVRIDLTPAFRLCISGHHWRAFIRREPCRLIIGL